MTSSLAAYPILVISGPSGVGKGTVIAALRRKYPALQWSVSATTRHPRAGEVDGQHYYFVSGDEFDRKITGGEFLEWAPVHSHRYGTLRSQVLEKAAKGPVVIEVDVQGACCIRDSGLKHLSLFLMPPDWAALETRLRGRQTEVGYELEKRLERAKAEMVLADQYQYVVVNDVLEQTLEQIGQIIEENVNTRSGL